MGIVAMLLAACGAGGSPRAGSGDDSVASGQEGLEQVRGEAVELLRTLTPRVADSTGASLESSEGAYRETGSFGQDLGYEYSAEATFTTGGSFDEAAVVAVLEDADLEVSTSDDPGGERVVLGRGGGISASVRAEPGARTFALRVRRTGASVPQQELPADRRAELREPTPIDLG